MKLSQSQFDKAVNQITDLINEEIECLLDFDLETSVVSPWAEIMSASYLESWKIHVHCSRDGEAECSELDEKGCELLKRSVKSLLDYMYYAERLMKVNRRRIDSLEQTFSEVNSVAARFGLSAAVEKIDEEAQAVDFIIVAD